MVKTGKERQKRMYTKNVKSGAVLKTKTYRYLGITINKEDNLEKITYKKM